VSALARRLIHPWVEAFADAVDAYERGRPGYPAAAVDFLVDRLELGPGRTVVDLGAGTGKLSRLLVSSGATIVAVEPVDEMRARVPAGIDARPGTAEAIPLPDGAADAIVVAQAFHWFRAGDALREIHRVLRPDGRLALVRNRRDDADPLQRAFAEVLQRHRGHPSLEREADLDEGSLFSSTERRSFPHVHRLDAEGLAALAGSESSIAMLDEAARAAALAEFAALAPASRDPVELRYVTDIIVGNRCQGQ
jgi:SAM-dependent methyltransferase